MIYAAAVSGWLLLLLPVGCGCFCCGAGADSLQHLMVGGLQKPGCCKLLLQAFNNSQQPAGEQFAALHTRG